ncbi:hypothetical protein [Leptospira sp. P2653]|uniref:hypothetical protein n=1 Tax=Leptospira sp. P2653 TaxID=1218600 RepID=UPI0002BEEDC9|nr:hypothetical protein [Leptospira sp. P2653]EMJ67205.1 hypothetical protein LEP1GSC051_0876 [Leptospira sp. P2653]
MDLIAATEVAKQFIARQNTHDLALNGIPLEHEHVFSFNYNSAKYLTILVNC